MRPSAGVELSGHWNGVDQRADATFSLKPVAAEATAGTTSKASAASRETTYVHRLPGRSVDRLRGNRGSRMIELLVEVTGTVRADRMLEAP